MARAGLRSSTRHDDRRAGRLGFLSGVLGASLLVLGALLPTSTPAAVPVAETAAPPPPGKSITADATTSAGPELPVAREVDSSTPAPPTRLDIPRIGVHTEVVPVGLNPDGTVMVPPVDPGAPAGWYRHLASPGQPGPAVLLGHVDSYEGPAVFYRLSALVPGDDISIDRADGRTVLFTVRSVQIYPKTSFPTELVYGHSDEPVLRLITCGGAFDRVRRSYISNVVVYAELAR